jgi:hypothetical protein
VGRTGGLRKHKDAKPGERYRNYWCSRAAQSKAMCAYSNGHSAPKREAAILEYLGQYSDPKRVKELLGATQRHETKKKETELQRTERRLSELEADFEKNLDLLKRGVLNEGEFTKANEGRRAEMVHLDTDKDELAQWLNRQQESQHAVETLPQRIGSFLEDFRTLDTRRAKAMLQGILMAAHVSREGEIELEFR